VKEKIEIDGKIKELNRILVLSDMFFCIFEPEKKNHLLLTFWATIKSLVTIKKTINGEMCRFFWKQKNKKVYKIISF